MFRGQEFVWYNSNLSATGTLGASYLFPISHLSGRWGEASSETVSLLRLVEDDGAELSRRGVAPRRLVGSIH